MKTVSANLQAAINAGQICQITSLVATSGLAAYFTDHDKPITFGGNTYVPAPGLSRTSMKMVNTTEVSSQNVQAAVVDLPAAELLAGIWDDAVVTTSLLGYLMTTPEAMVVQAGQIGVIGWTDKAFQANMQNKLRNLGKNVGRQVMPTCRHALYDLDDDFDKIGACTILASAHTQAVTVNNILTPNLKFTISSSTQADGWASYGYVVFTSGANNGITEVVKIHSVNASPELEAVELYLPTTQPIAVGDTLNLLAGCDHTIATCAAKFSNQLNFGGFPNLQPDTNINIALGT